MKFVHTSCLNKWRKTNHLHSIKCEICKYTYKIYNSKIDLHKIHQLYKDRSSIVLITSLFFIFIISSIFFGSDTQHKFAQLFITNDVSYLFYYRIYFIFIFIIIYFIHLLLIFTSILNNINRYSLHCISLHKCYINHLFQFLLIFIIITISFLYTYDFYSLNILYDILYSTILIDLTNRSHIHTINYLNLISDIEEPIYINYK
jgi:hypothetical protein